MPRYALKIEYDGSPFSGWQRQTDQPTVQGTLEAALAKLESEVPSIVGAGRTDAGVHAWGQIAHCDLRKPWQGERLCAALNYHLRPHPIAITACAPVASDWHARFSAIARTYVFRLVVRPGPLTHHRGLAWRVSHDLDTEAMAEGAAHLLGRHDFTTFRSSICQSQSPIKTLDRLDISAKDYPGGGREIQFHVEARSFLHNQVRSFVGTLERVGAGSWSPARVDEALMARDRAACGPVCPPHGLYLAEVRYPKDPFL